MRLLIFKYFRWQLGFVLRLLSKPINRDILLRDTLSFDQLAMGVLKIVIVRHISCLRPIKTGVIIHDLHPRVRSANWSAIWIIFFIVGLAGFFFILLREFVTSWFRMWLLERLLVLVSWIVLNWIIIILIRLQNLRRVLRHSSRLNSSLDGTPLPWALGRWDRNLVLI